MSLDKGLKTLPEYAGKSVRLASESFDFPEIEPLISEGDKNDVVIDITIKRMTYQNIWNNEGKYQQTGFKKSGIRNSSICK
jgi:hypothetical protein